MTRLDLDLHGCKLAEAWHEAGTLPMGTGIRRAQCLDLATAIAAGDPAVACYLGARVTDRLEFLGFPMDAMDWIEALERRAVEESSGDRAG